MPGREAAIRNPRLRGGGWHSGAVSSLDPVYLLDEEPPSAELRESYLEKVRWGSRRRKKTLRLRNALFLKLAIRFDELSGSKL